MNLGDIALLLDAARKQIAHSEYVIVGSLSVMGLLRENSSIPDRMLMSNDVDGYPANDPERGFELTAALGQGSAFEREHGFYFDPVSPKLPTLPDGWQARLIRVDLPNGIIVKFLDPNDAAVSKYARGERRDEEWIRAGLESSILSLATIKHRFSQTSFLDDQEATAARQRLAADEVWLNGPQHRARPRPR